MNSSSPSVLHGKLASRKGVPSLAIDLTFPSGAPSGQFVRIQYQSHRPHPALANHLLRAFSAFEPVIVDPGEIRGVIKDGQQGGVILTPKPIHGGQLHAGSSTRSLRGNKTKKGVL